MSNAKHVCKMIDVPHTDAQSVRWRVLPETFVAHNKFNHVFDKVCLVCGRTDLVAEVFLRSWEKKYETSMSDAERARMLVDAAIKKLGGLVEALEPTQLATRTLRADEPTPAVPQLVPEPAPTADVLESKS